MKVYKFLVYPEEQHLGLIKTLEAISEKEAWLKIQAEFNEATDIFIVS